jgi:hypothetical protein
VAQHHLAVVPGYRMDQTEDQAVDVNTRRTRTTPLVVVEAVSYCNRRIQKNKRTIEEESSRHDMYDTTLDTLIIRRLCG